ncbi:Tbc1 domain family member 24-like protein, partial [Caligus rogercresseyi]
TNYLSSVNGINGQIKREFSSFDATGTLPPTFSKVFHALKTIPPTSVEAERAFSAAGLFAAVYMTEA